MNDMNQQQQQQQMMNPNMMMNSSSINQMPPPPRQQQPQQPQMLLPIPNNNNRNTTYGMWPPQQLPPPQFQNPNPGPINNPPPFNNKSLGPRSNTNWKKGKKVNNKPKNNDNRRNDSMPPGASSSSLFTNLNFNTYQPPNLNELQHQNRVKARKFFPKKKYINKNNMNMMNNMNINNNNNMGGGGGGFHNFSNNRSAPYAPRNTTSFLIRAKKSGGIAPLVSPCPVTPAVLPTPIFSPSKEVLVDMAKEEWGVDGYGSMKGLIRLRADGNEMEANEDDEDDEGGSSDSDVEEHVEVERRLDHDLSRFEMIYNPNNNNSGMEYHNVLENRVDDQDSHIAHLEEENLILKERLFLMEREFADLRRRMLSLERAGGGEEINEEVVENESGNESDSRGEEEDAHSMEDNHDDFDDKGVNEADNCISVVDAGSKEESIKDSVVGTDINVDDNNEDKCVDEKVKVEDNVDVESSERVMVVEEDVCMEEGGVERENMVSEKDVADSVITEVK